jgi:opacity protein-like surface antigen
MRGPLLLLVAFCTAGVHPAAGSEAVADPAVASRSDTEFLQPGMAAGPFHVTGGANRHRHALSVSPALGWIGDQPLFAFRIAYNPNSWLGYEAYLGHNPGQSVQALFHMLDVIVRVPLSGRFQPYATAGYGMMLVFPGRLLNADPVTENTLGVGGGLEIFLRDDVALRGEFRHLTVLGGERASDATVAYQYREATLGLAFYRNLGRSPDAP